MRRALVVATALVLVAGCDPGEREARPFVGRWESNGYGLYLDVHGGEADVYEYSSVHCLPVVATSARGMSEVMSIEGEQLVFRDGGREIAFDPIASLPELCVDGEEGAAAVYAVAVATIAEHLYPAPDAAWRDAVSAYGEDLGASPGDLHGALVLALGQLGDPEVRLASGDEAAPWPSSSPLGELLAARWQTDGRLLVGEPAPGVAYLGLRELVVETADDQRVLAAAIDRALAATDAVIIDLRAASGGVEEAALQIATRFVPTTRVVATLWARDGDDLVDTGDLSVTPLATGVYEGSVVVLVGPYTSGAGELLARVLSDLPGVTIVGDPTAGSPREPLVRALPNGWSLGVPNLDIRGPDGSSWVEPLVPAVSAPTTVADLEAGKDPGLEMALVVLAES